MKITFIYALKCPEDNIVKYVGKSTDVNKRVVKHLSHAIDNPQLEGKPKWLRELHEKGLSPIVGIIEVCNDSNWEEREIYWISRYKQVNPNLFNKAKGGEDSIFKKNNIPWNKGGGEYSDGTRQKMREAKLGATLPEEQKQKISESLLGKSKSEEHVMNIRKGLGKEVQQWDTNGNLIAEYPAASFAAEAIGCKRESIRDACNGKIKLCKGFKWTLK